MKHETFYIAKDNVDFATIARLVHDLDHWRSLQGCTVDIIDVSTGELYAHRYGNGLWEICV